MPHQDQLYSGYRPTDWNDLKLLLEELGVANVPDASVSAEDRYEFLGELPVLTTVKVDPTITQFVSQGRHKSLTEDLQVRVHLANWDGEDDQYRIVDPMPDTANIFTSGSSYVSKPWLCVGVALTSRYRPAVLDIVPLGPNMVRDAGRDDFFEIDLEKVTKINQALAAKLKRPVSLILGCNFY